MGVLRLVLRKISSQIQVYFISDISINYLADIVYEIDNDSRIDNRMFSDAEFRKEHPEWYEGILDEWMDKNGQAIIFSLDLLNCDTKFIDNYRTYYPEIEPPHFKVPDKHYPKRITDESEEENIIL